MPTARFLRPPLFEEARLIINLESALVVAGRLQNEPGMIHVMAEKIDALLPLGLPEQASHNYHGAIFPLTSW